MTQFNFHNFEPGKSIHTHTHTQILPIIQRFITVYKLWYEIRNNAPKRSRYTLAAKVDILIVDTIELLFVSGALGREQKLPILLKASGKFDLLKFFLQIAWEVKILDTKKYVLLSEDLNQIGKMLGGWIKSLQPVD